MVSKFGRHYVAIPGPSVLPDRVIQSMVRAAPNIYAGELEEMVGGIISDLGEIARTNWYSTIYIANGHGAWEAAIANTMNRGDKILVLSTGIFAAGWGEFARAMGVDVETIEFGRSSDIDLNVAADKLAADKAHEIKAVLAVHVDTSTSVRNDIRGLAAAIKQVRHPALLIVDCIASLACESFEMDKWGVDVMISGSQKGLMTPTGLGFLFFNERARERCKNVDLRTPYWSWERRIEPEEFYMTFCGTAPTHHLFALREALNMLIREEGMDKVIARHALNARAVWSAFDTWSTIGPIGLNIQDQGKRSHSVTAIRIGAPNGRRLRNWTEDNADLTLGIGLGMSTPEDPESDGSFRLGHMGHLNANMIMAALGSIEAGLEAIGIDRGKGALDAAAATYARSSLSRSNVSETREFESALLREAV